MILSRHILLDREKNTTTTQLQRRILRDCSNPLSGLSEFEFISRYRLSKTAFKYVLDNLDIRGGFKTTYIPPILKLVVTLNILAGAGYQRLSSSDFVAPMAQSTASKILSEVVDAIESQFCSNWVKFDESFTQTKNYVYTKYGIPGVVGFIDAFFNSKGRHSINVMIICDSQKRIIAICQKYCGSAHVPFVWSSSFEKKYFERRYNTGENNSWLLGDAGYPLEPWLITSFTHRQGQEAGEIRFNKIHSKARSTIERCIGIYKGRWRILLDERKARYSPLKVAKFVNVCAALHNICKHFNIPEPSYEMVPAEAIDVEVDMLQDNRRNNLRRHAERKREQIKNSL